MNKVSVIIPIYNAEPYLSEMLDSILAQTWQNIQLVAVNDGSSDRSEDIFLRYEPELKEKLSVFVVKYPTRTILIAILVLNVLLFVIAALLISALPPA